MAMLAASMLPFSSWKAKVAVFAAVGEAGQQRLLLLLRAGVEDRGRGQRGREEWRAQQVAAHLLQHDAELAEAEALAAIGLGDVDAGEAELLVQLLPALAVEARRRSPSGGAPPWWASAPPGRAAGCRGIPPVQPKS